MTNLAGTRWVPFLSDPTFTGLSSPLCACPKLAYVVHTLLNLHLLCILWLHVHKACQILKIHLFAQRFQIFYLSQSSKQFYEVSGLNTIIISNLQQKRLRTRIISSHCPVQGYGSAYPTILELSSSLPSPPDTRCNLFKIGDCLQRGCTSDIQHIVNTQSTVAQLRIYLVREVFSDLHCPLLPSGQKKQFYAYMIQAQVLESCQVGFTFQLHDLLGV